MKILRRAAGLILELLRELSDENGYRRHLAAHNAAPSPEQWRHYCDCRFKAKYARAKCC
jgi:hypothetical protein